LLSSLNLKDILLENIVTGPSQTRVSQLDKDLDILALSMKTLGLLEPITVFLNDEGKYEILAGQRRFSAAKQLEWKTIPAIIRPKPEDMALAKAISLSENLTRNPMVTSDIMDACDMLFKRYNGSVKLVSQKTGLHAKIINKYVKFARLPQIVKEAFDKGELGSDPKKAMVSAMGAVNMLDYTPEGQVDEKKVLDFAKLLAKKTATEQRDLQIVAKMDPTQPLEKMEEKAKQPRQVKKLPLVIDNEDYSRLESYTDKTNSGSPENAAVDLIHDGLDRAGV